MRSRTAGVMTTLMRNGRDRRSENPLWADAIVERVFVVGTDQRITSGPAATAAASQRGKPRRENRPDTWLHPNASQKSQICSCNAGTVHTWPIATRRLRMTERRFRRKAEMALSSLPCAASRRLVSAVPYSRSAISFARKMSCKSKKTLAIDADSQGRRIHGLPRFPSPFLIIDLAKISTSPICSLSAVLLARPILTPVLSPEDQRSEPSGLALTERPRLPSGSLF